MMDEGHGDLAFGLQGKTGRCSMEWIFFLRVW